MKSPIWGFREKLINPLIFFLLFFLSFPLFSANKCLILQNKEVTQVSPGEYGIYQLSTRKFYRAGFEVRDVQFKNIGNFLETFAALIEKEETGILVCNPVFSPLLVKDDVYIKYKKFKIVTWGMMPDYKFSLSSPVFNITISAEIVADRMIGLLKKISKKKDLSDTLAVINTDYWMTEKLQEYCEEKKYRINFIDKPGDAAVIKNWLTNNGNVEAAVFFAFRSNRIINDLESSGLKDLRIIEVMSGYGELIPSVKYSIDVDWFYVYFKGIYSAPFHDFMRNQKHDVKLTNYYIKNPRAVIVRKYNHALVNQIQEQK